MAHRMSPTDFRHSAPITLSCCRLQVACVMTFETSTTLGSFVDGLLNILVIADHVACGMGASRKASSLETIQSAVAEAYRGLCPGARPVGRVGAGGTSALRARGGQHRHSRS